MGVLFFLSDQSDNKILYPLESVRSGLAEADLFNTALNMDCSPEALDSVTSVSTFNFLPILTAGGLVF